MRQALLLADEVGDLAGAIRACMNLGYLLSIGGREREALTVTARGLETARRRGDRVWERSLAANLCGGYFATGQWDEAERVAAELPDDESIGTDPVHAGIPVTLAYISFRRGDGARAAQLVSRITRWSSSERVQAEAIRIEARALTAIADGRYDDAMSECTAALHDERIGSVPTYADACVGLGGDAAWLGRSTDGLETIVALATETPRRTAFGRAVLALSRGRLGVLRDDPSPPFAEAHEQLRLLGDPFLLATGQLEQAEWLVDHDRADEAAPLVSEAREVFERLRAAPSLERAERLEESLAAHTG